MTETEQRITIAEQLGWKIESHGRPWEDKPIYWRLRRPDGSIRYGGCTGEEWSREMFSKMVPDYLNDLNTCADFEKHLTTLALPTIAKACYIGWLNHFLGGASHPEMDINNTFALLCATPAQRCEAFLRSQSLWIETPTEAQP